MPGRRISSSQIRSQMRQAQRQAETQMKREIKKAERQINQQLARQQRENQRKLDQQVRRWNQRQQSKVSTTHTVYFQSTEALYSSYQHLDQGTVNQSIYASNDLLDYADLETANSLMVSAALEEARPDDTDPGDQLRLSAVSTELWEIKPDLAARWEGALFALNPRNPDAARHFCTSSREILTTILETRAPDADVKKADPHCPVTEKGTATRRARIEYLLKRRGESSQEAVNFVDADITNVVRLFDVLNPATHGDAGTYSLSQLKPIKERLEGAYRFLHWISV